MWSDTLYENAAAKANIVMKVSTIAIVALKASAHEARVVALFQVELRRRKTANAQLGFSRSTYKLLHTFVIPEN
jgi:hypothetical protein